MDVFKRVLDSEIECYEDLMSNASLDVIYDDVLSSVDDEEHVRY